MMQPMQKTFEQFSAFTIYVSLLIFSTCRGEFFLFSDISDYDLLMIILATVAIGNWVDSLVDSKNCLRALTTQNHLSLHQLMKGQGE